MAKRNLCRRHFREEQEGLTMIQELHTADWQEVESCEMCEAERADLRAALIEALPILEEHAITLGRLAHRDTKAQPGIQRMRDEALQVIEQARAALEAGDG
jgi:hypothetical protein